MELQTNVKTGDLKITAPEVGEATVVAPKEQVIGETPKQPDLITRVSQVKVDKPEEIKETTEEGKFNINELDSEIDKLPDPKLKEQVLGLKKSLLRGENQKYQEIANLRKQYEQKLADSSNWTPERIQGLMNDPNFVKAAQSVVQSQNPAASGLTDEQWSNLSEPEKQKMMGMEKEIQSLKQQNLVSQWRQEDDKLKTKYANYEPQAVDIITNDILTGKVRANREDLWKVYDYDNAVRRAYELGKQDRLVETNEKISATSIEGGQVTPQKEVPTPEKNESPQAYFGRLVMNNIARQAQKK